MSERVVFANDLPYSSAEENPLEALKSTLAFAVDDWGATRAMSWVYGIVLGWDDDDEGPTVDGAMSEQAERHGWSDEAVARLRRLHAAFNAPEAGDLLYMAWTIIANANEGDWSKATPEWRAAAERWRDDFHAQLAVMTASAPSRPSTPGEPT